MEIRHYNDSDKDEILRLYQGFGQYFVEIDNLKRCIVAENYASHFFDEMVKETTEKKGQIWVAEGNQNKLVGFCAINIKDITAENSVESVPHKKGRILELYVDKDYRGQGVGTKLMDTMLAYANESSCDVVNVEVFAPNKRAYDFYKKFGFFDRNYDLMKIF
jgi:ribosomal protein S18 acetylase RimI-like enzyme